jgi:hypothetical protein
MAQGMAPVRYDIIRMAGGLDLVTPTLSLPPGTARDALNFEASITGGYSRIAGYERFDGRPSPSAATYGAITVNLSATVSVGNTIVGDSSAATGYVISVATNQLVYTKATSAFTAGEVIRVGGVSKGTITALGAATTPTSKQAAEYTNLAADVYRADITTVTGSGSIRGVVYYKDVVYAWRNNSAGTAMAIYKSSGSGWTLVPLGYEMPFSTGSIEIVEGNIVVGQTSGATATITRVVLSSGTWAGSTAAGYLYFASFTGSFSAGETLRVSGTPYAVVGATGAAAITLAPSGRVETVMGNFGGNSNQTRIYGCDGVNTGFEFDGTVYVKIRTGMTPSDVPTKVAFHKQHLFFAYGHSIQFSALGLPYQWSPVLGAGEIALTNDVTNFLVQPGDQATGAMAIYTDSDTFILYGTSSANWNLVSYNVGTGAKSYTAQNMSQSYVFDDRGVINLQTTLNYGNFDSAALTLNIRPFIQQRRNLATGSSLNREKAQYRVYFSDTYALYMTISNNQLLGAMPVQFAHAVTVICEGESPDAAETSFFGSTNGYVYRLDAGTSFDGEEISANVTLVFNAIKSPRILKRYRKGSLEITGTSYAEFTFSYDLGYSSTDLGQDTGNQYSSNLVSSFWDSVSWDAFVWDGRTLAPSEVELVGTAENIAVRIASISDIYAPFTVNSTILHYSMRRGLR